MASYLGISEIYKYDWRLELFLNKYKSEDQFTLLDGNSKKFVYSEQIYQWIENKETDHLRGKILLGDDNVYYSLTDLQKTSEFGGRGSGSGTHIEEREIAKVNQAIEDVITLKIGESKHDVKKVDKTPGTPKSDMHFLDVNSNEVIWLSHKAGSKPTDFQQFGGMTEKGIRESPEITDFIHTTQKMFPSGIPNKTTVARKIEDSNLKLKSVYGIDYGKELGRQNVSLVVQGNLKLEANNGFYSVNANMVHVNGVAMANNYEPVLMSSYKGDRTQFGVKGARFTISPIGCRKINLFI